MHPNARSDATTSVENICKLWETRFLDGHNKSQTRHTNSGASYNNSGASYNTSCPTNIDFRKKIKRQSEFITGFAFIMVKLVVEAATIIPIAATLILKQATLF